MSAMDNNSLPNAVQFSVETNDLENLQKNTDKKFSKSDNSETIFNKNDYNETNDKERCSNLPNLDSDNISEIKKPTKRSHQPTKGNLLTKSRKIDEEIVLNSDPCTFKTRPSDEKSSVMSDNQCNIQSFPKVNDITSKISDDLLEINDNKLSGCSHNEKSDIELKLKKESKTSDVKKKAERKLDEFNTKVESVNSDKHSSCANKVRSGHNKSSREKKNDDKKNPIIQKGIEQEKLEKDIKIPKLDSDSEVIKKDSKKDEERKKVTEVKTATKKSHSDSGKGTSKSGNDKNTSSDKKSREYSKTQPKESKIDSRTGKGSTKDVKSDSQNVKKSKNIAESGEEGNSIKSKDLEKKVEKTRSNVERSTKNDVKSDIKFDKETKESGLIAQPLITISSKSNEQKSDKGDIKVVEASLHQSKEDTTTTEQDSTTISLCDNNTKKERCIAAEECTEITLTKKIEDSTKTVQNLSKPNESETLIEQSKDKSQKSSKKSSKKKDYRKDKEIKKDRKSDKDSHKSIKDSTSEKHKYKSKKSKTKDDERKPKSEKSSLPRGYAERPASKSKHRKSSKKRSSSESDHHNRSYRSKKHKKSRERRRRTSSSSSSSSSSRSSSSSGSRVVRSSVGRSSKYKMHQSLQMGPLNLREEFLLETDCDIVNADCFDGSKTKTGLKNKRIIAEKLQKLLKKNLTKQDDKAIRDNTQTSILTGELQSDIKQPTNDDSPQTSSLSIPLPKSSKIQYPNEDVRKVSHKKEVPEIQTIVIPLPKKSKCNETDLLSDNTLPFVIPMPKSSKKKSIATEAHKTSNLNDLSIDLPPEAPNNELVNDGTLQLFSENLGLSIPLPKLNKNKTVLQDSGKLSATKELDLSSKHSIDEKNVSGEISSLTIPLPKSSKKKSVNVESNKFSHQEQIPDIPPPPKDTTSSEECQKLTIEKLNSSLKPHKTKSNNRDLFIPPPPITVQTISELPIPPPPESSLMNSEIPIPPPPEDVPEVSKNKPIKLEFQQPSNEKILSKNILNKTDKTQITNIEDSKSSRGKPTKTPETKSDENTTKSAHKTHKSKREKVSFMIPIVKAAPKQPIIVEAHELFQQPTEDTNKPLDSFKSFLMKVAKNQQINTESEKLLDQENPAKNPLSELDTKPQTDEISPDKSESLASIFSAKNIFEESKPAKQKHTKTSSKSKEHKHDEILNVKIGDSKNETIEIDAKLLSIIKEALTVSDSHKTELVKEEKSGQMSHKKEGGHRVHKSSQKKETIDKVQQSSQGKDAISVTKSESITNKGMSKKKEHQSNKTEVTKDSILAKNQQATEKRDTFDIEKSNIKDVIELDIIHKKDSIETEKIHKKDVIKTDKSHKDSFEVEKSHKKDVMETEKSHKESFKVEKSHKKDVIETEKSHKDSFEVEKSHKKDVMETEKSDKKCSFEAEKRYENDVTQTEKSHKKDSLDVDKRFKNEVLPKNQKESPTNPPISYRMKNEHQTEKIPHKSDNKDSENIKSQSLENITQKPLITAVSSLDKYDCRIGQSKEVFNLRKLMIGKSVDKPTVELIDKPLPVFNEISQANVGQKNVTDQSDSIQNLSIRTGIQKPSFKAEFQKNSQSCKSSKQPTSILSNRKKDTTNTVKQESVKNKPTRNVIKHLSQKPDTVITFLPKTSKITSAENTTPLLKPSCDKSTQEVSSISPGRLEYQKTTTKSIQTATALEIIPQITSSTENISALKEESIIISTSKQSPNETIPIQIISDISKIDAASNESDTISENPLDKIDYHFEPVFLNDIFIQKTVILEPLIKTCNISFKHKNIKERNTLSKPNEENVNIDVSEFKWPFNAIQCEQKSPTDQVATLSSALDTCLSQLSEKSKDSKQLLQLGVKHNIKFSLKQPKRIENVNKLLTGTKSVDAKRKSIEISKQQVISQIPSITSEKETKEQEIASDITNELLKNLEKFKEESKKSVPIKSVTDTDKLVTSKESAKKSKAISKKSKTVVKNKIETSKSKCLKKPLVTKESTKNISQPITVAPSDSTSKVVKKPKDVEKDKNKSVQAQVSLTLKIDKSQVVGSVNKLDQAKDDSSGKKMEDTQKITQTDNQLENKEDLKKLNVKDSDNVIDLTQGSNEVEKPESSKEVKKPAESKPKKPKEKRSKSCSSTDSGRSKRKKSHSEKKRQTKRSESRSKSKHKKRSRDDKDRQVSESKSVSRRKVRASKSSDSSTSSSSDSSVESRHRHRRSSRTYRSRDHSRSHRNKNARKRKLSRSRSKSGTKSRKVSRSKSRHGHLSESSTEQERKEDSVGENKCQRISHSMSKKDQDDCRKEQTFDLRKLIREKSQSKLNIRSRTKSKSCERSPTPNISMAGQFKCMNRPINAEEFENILRASQSRQLNPLNVFNENTVMEMLNQASMNQFENLRMIGNTPMKQFENEMMMGYTPVKSFENLRMMNNNSVQSLENQMMMAQKNVNQFENQRIMAQTSVNQFENPMMMGQTPVKPFENQHMMSQAPVKQFENPLMMGHSSLKPQENPIGLTLDMEGRTLTEKCIISFLNQIVQGNLGQNLPVQDASNTYTNEVSYNSLDSSNYYPKPAVNVTQNINTPSQDYFVNSQPLIPNTTQVYPPICKPKPESNPFILPTIFPPTYPNSSIAQQPHDTIYHQQTSSGNYPQNDYSITGYGTSIKDNVPLSDLTPSILAPIWNSMEILPKNVQTSVPVKPIVDRIVIPLMSLDSKPPKTQIDLTSPKSSSSSSLSDFIMDMEVASPSMQSIDSSLRLDQDMSDRDDLSWCSEFKCETVQEIPDPFQKYSDAPKPQYEHIVKTEVHMSAVGKRFEYSYLKSTSCNCVPPNPDEIRFGKAACDENCFNRQIKVECNRNCPVYELCTNRQFQEQTYASLEPFYCGKEKGWGVRAQTIIDPGTFIIEYVGELINFNEFIRRINQNMAYNRNYLMVIQKGLYIDAGNKGNWSRFINHSCSPNTVVERWVVNGKTRIGFFAMKTIAKGEEITIDYQFQQYGSIEQKCFCKTARCMGILGKVNEKLQEQIRNSERCRRQELINQIISRNSLKEIQHVSEMITVIKEDILDRDTFFSFLEVLLRSTSHQCIRTFIECGGLNAITSNLEVVHWDDWFLKLLYLQCLDHFKLKKRAIIKSGYTSVSVVEYWSQNPRFELKRAEDECVNVELSFTDDVEIASDSLADSPVENECQLKFTMPINNVPICEIERHVQSLASNIRDYFNTEKAKFFIPKIKGSRPEISGDFSANESESKSISIASSVQADFVETKTKKLRKTCSEVIQKLSKEEFRRLFSERYHRSVTDTNQNITRTGFCDNYTKVFQTIKQLLSGVIIDEVNQLKQNEQFCTMPLEFQNLDIDKIISGLNIVEKNGLLSLSQISEEDTSTSSTPSKSSDDTLKTQNDSALYSTDRLPPNWRFCRCENGRVYFYHTISKKTQWDTPVYPWDAGQEDPNAYDFGDAHKYQVSFDEIKEMYEKMKANEEHEKKQLREKKRKERTIQRKLSLSAGDRNKIKFSREVFKSVKSIMKPFFSSTCKLGRVRSKQDMKYLCEKFSDTIIGKEVKQVTNLEDLDLNSDVLAKMKSYIVKYMTRQGRVYKRSKKHQSKPDRGRGNDSPNFPM